MGLERTHKREFKVGSTYITKKIKQLIHVEWKWCDELIKDNLSHSPQPLGGGTTPLPIVYFMPLHKDYI
jgi:hypothetical protein